jgi:iron complex outermembrane receptor protein
MKKNDIKKNLWLGTLLTFATTCVNAQEIKVNEKPIRDIRRDTLRQINLPDIVTVSRRIGVLESIRSIDKKTLLRLNQAQDLPMMLNTLSSVVANSDAGTGTGYTALRIRGTDLTRIQVSMNGIPVNDPESHYTFFVNTPDLISSAQSVSITKGVGTSRSGSGNLGAGIAINTLDVYDAYASVRYQSDFGSFNTFRNSLRLTTGLINDRFVATVRASSIISDGYIARSGANLKSIQATAKYLFSKNTQLIVNYMRGREKTGQAWNGVSEEQLSIDRRFNELGRKADGTFYNNQTDNYGQDYYQAFLSHKLNSHFNTGVDLFYTRGKGYYEEFRTEQAFSKYGLNNFIQGGDTVTQTDLIRQLWLDNHFYGGRTYLTFQSNKLDAGLYLNANQYKAKHYGDIIWAQYGVPDHFRWYNLSAQKNEANIYGMIDWRFKPGWSWFSDWQVRHIQYDINGFRDNPQIEHQLNWTFFNPKTKLSYQKGAHEVSWVAGIVSKEPNRNDVEAGTAQLPRPERLYNTEINHIYETKYIRYFSTAFLMYYKDQLILTGQINDVGAYTRTNVPNSYRYGIEEEIQFKWQERGIEAALNVAWSQNKIPSFTEYIDDYDQGGQKAIEHKNTNIAFSPTWVAGGRISVNAGGVMRLPKSSVWHRASIDVLPKVVSRQYLDNTQNNARSIAGFSNTDVLLHWQQRSGFGSVQFRLGVYNIFNAMYANNGYTFSYIYNQETTTANYFYPQAGRRWMAGVSLQF